MRAETATIAVMAKGKNKDERAKSRGRRDANEHAHEAADRLDHAGKKKQVEPDTTSSSSSRPTALTAPGLAR